VRASNAVLAPAQRAPGPRAVLPGDGTQAQIPVTPPQCPDCHGEVPTETVADEDAAQWCDDWWMIVRVGVVA
jgi:hypothetical protein